MATIIDENIKESLEHTDIKIISNYMMVRFDEFCVCITKEELEEWLKQMEEK